jgi:hypothetical protein
MQAAIKRTIGNLDFYAYSDRYKQDNLRSIEECFYHKLLVESLDKPEGILENVGRWSSPRLTN